MRAAPPAGIPPTLCYLENLTPVNVCRVCVVEVAGSRTLVPACSRKAEAGMDVQTDSERVRLSRKMVLEFLGSSVDTSLAGPRTPTGEMARYAERYGADATRYGSPAAPAQADERDARESRPPPRPVRREGGHRRPAGQGRQRPVRPRLLEMHPLLQVRRGVRGGRPEHVRHRGRRARLRRPDLDRMERGPARFRVRLLRQLHRRLPDRCAHVQVRARHARRPARGTSRPRP